MAAKHFIIYYQKGAGTYIVTEPRPWARENKKHFPAHDFITNHPTVAKIEKVLIERFHFKKVVNTKNIVLIQNVDPDLNFDK
jgi:hypothetical protein